MDYPTEIDRLPLIFISGSMVNLVPREKGHCRVQSVSPGTMSTQKHSNILIIEDSSVITGRLIPELESLDNVNQLFHGTSLDAGIDLLDKHLIDIALIDIHLPGKSGIDLLSLIQQKKYALQLIIMMSAVPSLHTKERCLQLGAHYFADKFEDFEQIIGMISAFHPA